MMDLVSTRNDVDQQTQGCAKLLAAVIAKAIEDLTIEPTRREQKSAINYQVDAVRSVIFLRSKTFLHYCQLIGVNGEALMYNLAYKEMKPKKSDKLSEAHYRIIKARLRWSLPPMGRKPKEVTEEA